MKLIRYNEIIIVAAGKPKIVIFLRRNRNRMNRIARIKNLLYPVSPVHPVLIF